MSYAPTLTTYLHYDKKGIKLWFLYGAGEKSKLIKLRY